MNNRIETLAFVLTCLAIVYFYREFLDNMETRERQDSEQLRNMLLDIRNLVDPKKETAE